LLDVKYTWTLVNFLAGLALILPWQQWHLIQLYQALVLSMLMYAADMQACHM